MSYLETKRNAIMNAIASGQITNLLANCTWNDGYFGSGGSIVSASVNQERYEEEYIEVDTTKDYIYAIAHPNSTSYWCGFAEYDSNKTFVRRNAPNNNGLLKINFQNPFIRASFRTYGDAVVVLVDYDEFMEKFGISPNE